MTTTRADYGLLFGTLREIDRDPRLELQLVVTGTHLSTAFGLTAETITQDGFAIAARVDMGLDDDSEVGAARSLARAVDGFATVLEELAPDLLVLLGDRYEILAPAQVALLQRIPIAHLHGGECTEGQIDEAVRHAISKMAHIHCVAAEPYARRVIQLGERPESVHVVGATAFDQLERLTELSRAELETEIGFPLGDRAFAVTFHPETLSGVAPEAQIAPLLAALDAFPDAHVVFTGSNADPAGRRASRLVADYAAAAPDRRCYRESLGSHRYLNLLRHVDVVVGNSSSGIIEAPALGTPVVNVGDRQANRLRAPAVLDCPLESDPIRAAIERAGSPAVKALAERRETPYGAPGAAKRIVEILRETSLDGILQKHFHDLPTGSGDVC